VSASSTSSPSSPSSRHSRITVDCDARWPHFTAAYLRIAGDECAFIETETSHARPKLLAALEQAGRTPADVRWVVVTHAHLDHAAGAGGLLAACPNATLLAHPRAAKHLIDPTKLVKSATAVYGEARFAKLYGTIDPIPKERVRALEDGETFELGGATLRVHHTAGHANHHFVVDDPATASVYTGDSFGLVYPALQKNGLFALATTSPTNFDAKEARLSIERIRGLGETYACLTHFGASTEIDGIAQQLHAWIDRADAWVEEAARGSDTVEVITARLKEAWRDAIERESVARGLAFGAAEWELLAMDIDLNAQGLAVAAELKRNPPPPRAKS
jgi:glyoxylase-like metal-dependent hydrolase (beta-lactamase superfamily II)